MNITSPTLQTFECESEPLTQNTPAAARRRDRSRLDDSSTHRHPLTLQAFDCTNAENVVGMEAAKRPVGKERELTAKVSANAVGTVEQKVVSVLLGAATTANDSSVPKMEYFGEYLAQGWLIKQMKTVSTGDSQG